MHPSWPVPARAPGAPRESILALGLVTVLAAAASTACTSDSELPNVGLTPGDERSTGGGDPGPTPGDNAANPGDSPQGGDTLNLVPVDYCAVLAPSTVTLHGDDEVPDFTVVLFVAGRTQGTGAASGLSVDIGIGAGGGAVDTFTFAPATYLGDVDGLSVGDLANDSYRGKPVVAGPGGYRVIFRASADGGASYTYCDTTGSSDGFDLDDGVPVFHFALAIDYCALSAAGPFSAIDGVSSDEIETSVYVSGRSPGAGVGDDITVELGYGPNTDQPSEPTWLFTPARYLRDADGLTPGDLANDIYGATLLADPGTWALAARASIDDGDTWTLCDTNGSSDGFDLGDAGVLQVAEVSITEAYLQPPSNLIGVADIGLEILFSRVYVEGYSDGAGFAPNVSAEIGRGPDGSTPPAGWTFVAATANPFGPTALLDEYYARLPGSTAGDYDLAARFSLDGGGTWFYADLDGGANGYSPSVATNLTVIANAGVASLDFCETRFPTSLDIPMVDGQGGSSNVVYGHVYENPLTQATGWASGIVAEIGWGPGTDPLTNLGEWTFWPAVYRRDVNNDISDESVFENDEYEGFFLVPDGTDDPGTLHYTYRFSGDSGANWTYCSNVRELALVGQ